MQQTLFSWVRLGCCRCIKLPADCLRSHYMIRNSSLVDALAHTEFVFSWIIFIYYCGFEGSLNLVSGDPGVGKSTLLLQVCTIFFNSLMINFLWMNLWILINAWFICDVELEDGSIDSRRMQWQWWWGSSSCICLWWRGLPLISLVSSHSYYTFEVLNVQIIYSLYLYFSAKILVMKEQYENSVN